MPPNSRRFRNPACLPRPGSTVWKSKGEPFPAIAPLFVIAPHAAANHAVKMRVSLQTMLTAVAALSPQQLRRKVPTKSEMTSAHRKSLKTSAPSSPTPSKPRAEATAQPRPATRARCRNSGLLQRTAQGPSPQNHRYSRCRADLGRSRLCAT